MRLNTNRERILAISDLQIPYEHPDALAFCTALHDAIDATQVVCVGDEVDQHCVGRFDPDPDAFSAGPELKLAKRRLRRWYDTFPEVKVCTSNHTQRVYKTAFHAGIPEAYLYPVNVWLDAPDEWVWEDVHRVAGVRFEHGDAQGGMYAARNLAIRNRESTVIGHHHSHGAVFYIANDEEMIFGLNTGCLINMGSAAFKYAKLSTFKPTLGTGVILEGVPYFVPMTQTKSGRWDRTIRL